MTRHRWSYAFFAPTIFWLVYSAKACLILKHQPYTLVFKYTPEMNPIEQIWKEIRKLGFKNEVFQTLQKVIDRLCNTICSLSKDTIKSITGRRWILSIG